MIQLHKNNEILPFVTPRDLEGIMLSEISETEKDKYHMISLICGIWKKQNETENRHTDAENKVMVAKVKIGGALASEAQLIGASSHNQKVASLILSQGTYLSCRLILGPGKILGPGVSLVLVQLMLLFHINVSLSPFLCL